MSVKPIIPSIDDNNNVQKGKLKIQPQQVARPIKSMPIPQDSVSFTGAAINPIVGLMDFIEQGGYAASFIIQDGLGFITPRVGKGLLRGSLKTDENGQPILDENGKQKRELNWQLARKEFIREIITGPSAFLIPLAMFAGIKKWFGAANNVKLNYINGFEDPFTKFAKANAEAIAKGGELDKAQFYKNVYEEVIERSINSKLPDAEKLSAETISETAEKMASKLVDAEKIMADKTIKGKKAKMAKLAELGESVDDMFMKLKKQTLGGTVNELAVEFRDTKGGTKGGNISELGKALSDYFSDAVNSTKKALGEHFDAESIEKAIKNFTNRRMGSRILTNLGVFGAIALFYAQIPKLYNMGQNGNPALKGTALNNTIPKEETKKDTHGKRDVAFTGGVGKVLEAAGKKTFGNAKLKKISDIFEFDGNIISGAAMPVLLYGFCIPPRLRKAEDKYDYGEIVFRDITSFTALLFGAKALARLFSDGFTKITGLALNKKDMTDRNFFQKIFDYLNPLDKRHSVLSSKQLESKYTNIHLFKDGATGFMQFIEESGGDVKKALAQDKKIKAVVQEILSKFNGKSYADATVSEIKDAVKAAQKDADKTFINKFYELFKGENKLLNKAKTCNSALGFISTIILIPSLIIWIASKCEKMTKQRAEQDMAAAESERAQQAAKHLARRGQLAGQIPTMAGFLGNLR